MPAAPVAIVTEHGAQRLRAGHPWLYAGDLSGWQGDPPPAAGPAPTATLITLRDRRGYFLAHADFSPHSKIRARVLSRERAQIIDHDFWRGRLQAALDWRTRVARGATACRLVAAEADGLPGLIVDRYQTALAVQTLTWGMAARQAHLIAQLEELLAPLRIDTLVERNDVRVRAQEGLPLQAGVLRGSSAQVECTIDGLRFGVDLLAGQKTGGFLDQRENWAAVAGCAAALGARTALDVFTYQGGFALHLARAGLEVEAVDSSRPALEAAEANARRNGLNIGFVEANAFDLLRDYERAGRQFDLIVLDPPAFAKARANVDTAIAGYKEINLRALKMLRPGGLLVSCSCSFHVSEAALLELIAAAAIDAHRELTVLERRTQAADHPILLTMPETYYLKCILAVAR